MKPNFLTRRFLFCFGLTLLIVLIGFIPVRINIAFRQAPTPRAIFVLGGNFARTRFAGKFWLSGRDLDFWVSDFGQYLYQVRLISLGLTQKQRNSVITRRNRKVPEIASLHVVTVAMTSLRCVSPVLIKQ